MGEKKSEITVKINGKHQRIDSRSSEKTQSPRMSGMKQQVTSQRRSEQPQVRQKPALFVRTNAERTANGQNEFPWVIPDNRSSRPSFLNKRKKKMACGSVRRKTKWRKKTKSPRHRWHSRDPYYGKKQWVAVLSAVLIGIVMGLVVLMIFTDQGRHSVTLKSSGGPPLSAADSPSHSLDLSVYIMQGGAFSTIDKAQKAAEKFQTNGIPAVTIKEGSSDLHEVWIGLAFTKKGKEALSSFYKRQGQAVYVKKVQIPIADEKQVSDMAQKWLKTVRSLIQSGVTVSVSGLTSEKDQISKAELESIFRIEERWNQHWETWQNSESLSLSIRKIMSKVDRHLNGIVQALRDYQKTGQEQKLLAMQQELLNLLLLYKRALEFESG